jgi:hypothetical protein
MTAAGAVGSGPPRTGQAVRQYSGPRCPGLTLGMLLQAGPVPEG